ncbi:MAG: hypothetical protein KGL02_06360 [Acidobacteriota bacterium]|nr:hypothetical protein [Acidobacteriota bacterium]
MENHEMYTRLMNIRDFWRRISRTRYTRALEFEINRLQGECARLRQENRALLNSILGIAGIPPIDVGVAASTSAANPRSQPSLRAGSGAPAPTIPADADRPLGPVTEPASPSAQAISAPATGDRMPGGNLSQVATPLRRRSWHQVNRSLEFQAVRNMRVRQQADERRPSQE